MSTFARASQSPPPASQLLQDMIIKKQAQTRLRSASGTSSRSVSTPKYIEPRKNMGFRETEQYISKITHENFDLKLGIFQLRERAKAMEQQVQKTKLVEQQYQDIREANENLVADLKQRDLAMEEAVAMICELKQKVETLQGRGGYITPPSTASDTTPSSTASDTTPSTIKVTRPDNFSTMSFIPVNRPASILSNDDDDESSHSDIYSFIAPSLSVLSESSFMTVYGRYAHNASREIVPSLAGPIFGSHPLPPTPDTPKAARSPEPAPAIHRANSYETLNEEMDLQIPKSRAGSPGGAPVFMSGALQRPKSRAGSSGGAPAFMSGALQRPKSPAESSGKATVVGGGFGGLGRKFSGMGRSASQKLKLGLWKKKGGN